ncbi:MAG: GNAT family N-acetyltransferase [Chloroflexota bacterium]|nr:GNAT family N-acetyltransferase [Chloroflexota bacterium]
MTATLAASSPAHADDLPFTITPPLPHIREYRDADAAAVARMWRESASAWPGGGPSGGEHSSAARVRQEQRDLNTLATFIAYAPDPAGAGERAVGYCSLFEQPGNASAAYVGTLSAHPEWHGKGIGRDLLKASLARTVAQGYTRLDLNTWAGNLKAVPLYKKSGYFWVPDTSVRMENYLPLIFRLGPAQDFFRHADWYRDFRRDLSVTPDEEKQGQTEVFTYAWEHLGQRLRVVVDRHSKGVIAVETNAFSVSTSVDDSRLPIGGQRQVRWRVEKYGADGAPMGAEISPRHRPSVGPESSGADGAPTGAELSPRHRPPVLAVSIMAEGEDSVRCTLQTSQEVETLGEWTAPVTAEQPVTSPPSGRPTNRVRSTVVIDGQALPLALGTQVVQPVEVTVDSRRAWLTPGAERRLWLTAENSLDEAVQGTLRLAQTSGLAVEGSTTFEFDLAPRRKMSWPVAVRARSAGTYTMRAQATVSAVTESSGTSQTSGTTGPGNGARPELRTKVFEQVLTCGGPGDIFVQHTDEQLSIATDRFTVHVPLKPSRDWSVPFHVTDRASGERLLGHSCSLGPPFVPSVFSGSSWSARVERSVGSVTATLAASPASLPGLTFERVMRVSSSGLIQVLYRVVNAGAVERTLKIDAGTSVRLGMVSGTKVATPLTTGLVVEDSERFPDWEEPEQARPERYGETWMAEFGGGWVGATLWQGAAEVYAGWMSPSLTFDLGTIAAGGQAETPPLYLYAGPGDWKTARALWRQLLGPDAPEQSPEPRAAHRLRLERFVFAAGEAQTRLLLESERSRSMSGTAALEIAGRQVAESEVQRLRLGEPQAVPVSIALPPRAGAVPATLVFSHEQETERHDTAIIRAGDGVAPVSVIAEHDGTVERVRIENGRLRLIVVPAMLGRLLELGVPGNAVGSAPDADAGEWVNQLYSSAALPGTFVWFNPWYGGIHPVLYTGGSSSHPGKLREETFTWREATMTGAQGIQWRGVTASTEMKARGQAGLKLDVSYLTTGASNLVAIALRLENGSGARLGGQLQLSTFLQPGGDRTSGTLYYERDGLHHQKRVHGGMWGGTGPWCAVVAPHGPALTLVQATPNGAIDVRDMGLEGAHPEVEHSLSMAPGEVVESVTYLAVAADLDEARRYRALAGVGLV